MRTNSKENRIAIYIEAEKIHIKGKDVTALYQEVYCGQEQKAKTVEIVPSNALRETTMRRILSLLDDVQVESDKWPVSIYCSNDKIVWFCIELFSEYDILLKQGYHFKKNYLYDFCKQMSNYKSVEIRQNGVLTMSAKDEAKIFAKQAAEVYGRCNHRTKQRH